MSNETDRLVSDTYDELASEKTPEALNREVLRLAAKEGRTRYSIARAWTRPVAWAATIGLSLVIVLELADLPGPDMAPQSLPAEPQAAPRFDVRQADSAREEAVLESEAVEERKDSLAKRSRPYAPEERLAEKAAIEDDAAVGAATAGEPSAAMRVETFASATASLSAEQDYLCPAEARLSPAKWLSCIEELDADTPAERVEREYEALRKNYPDFEHAAADK